MAYIFSNAVSVASNSQLGMSAYATSESSVAHVLSAIKISSRYHFVSDYYRKMVLNSLAFPYSCPDGASLYL